MTINFKKKEAHCNFSEYSRLVEIIKESGLEIGEFIIHINDFPDWYRIIYPNIPYQDPFKQDWRDLLPKPGDIPNHFMTVTSNTTNGD